ASGSLRLFVRVTGRPAPTITWSKPGVDLHNRGFIEVTNTSTTLIIDKVNRYDAGRYTLVAENSAGKQEVSILVKVYAETKPSLRKEMDEVTAKLGQPAVMKCQIIGRPVPEIKWYHAGKEIIESRKYEMSSDGRNHSLSIMTDQQEDEGEYTCKAINDAGEAETTGMLVLEAAPSFHPDYPLKEIHFAGLGTTLRIHAVYIGRPEPKIMWLHGAKTLENTEDISIETTEHYTHLVIKNVDYSEETTPIIPAAAVEIRAPAFKEELRNMSVKYKSNATLVCKITGQPKPVIKWFRRGKEIRATNQGGSICATVSLDVESKLRNAVLHKKITMKSIPALRGEVVNIKIPFSGKPDPVITWQKGQDLIDSNGHYQVIVTRSFTSLVFPNGVEKKDAGFYIVCAKNRFGIDQQTVELDVADVPDPPRGVKASDVARDSVTLNWVAPANDGGSKVISYIIEKCPTTAERWQRVAQSRDTHYTVTNLFGGTSYQFRIIAENKFGQSAPSESSGPVMTKEDKSRVLLYDREVDDTGYVPRSKVLSQGGKYELFEDSGSAHLEIYELEASDSGVYKCTATNSAGAVSTMCTVSVQGKSTPDLYTYKCLNQRCQNYVCISVKLATAEFLKIRSWVK
uniref:Titin n=1 Tax=Maylandia zebra TaxID=106582 RepID=A0A3P9BDZ4_9CICH